MTANEAITLFKKDCGINGWRRFVRRYRNGDCRTVAMQIVQSYKPDNPKEVTSLLRAEIAASADAIDRHDRQAMIPKRLKTEAE